MVESIGSIKNSFIEGCINVREVHIAIVRTGGVRKGEERNVIF